MLASAGSQVSNASEAPQLHDESRVDIDEVEEPQPEELEAPQIREEHERRDAAEKQVEEQTTSMVKESKEYALNSLTSLSLTELKRLRDDE